MAMILKGLPESYGPFAVHVTQSDVNTSFAEFKTKLRRYEATEKMRTTGSDDNVMKGRMQPASASISDRGAESGDIVCFRCGLKGHKARSCQRKQWCSYCKSATHRDATCRRRYQQGFCMDVCIHRLYAIDNNYSRDKIMTTTFLKSLFPFGTFCAEI